MHNFLQDILKEENTIIIPGLGALTITSSKTGDIYFMPFLKHDDGHLSKYVSIHEGVELSEAKQILINFVAAIKTAIAEGDFFEMEEFGRFFKNKEGEIDFERWEDYQIKDNSILSKKIQERQQSQPKKIIPIVENKKEEPIVEKPIKSDEEIHHQIEEESPISSNPLHFKLEETIIHPIIEEEPETHQPITEKKSIDELLGDINTEELSISTESADVNESTTRISIDEIITPIEVDQTTSKTEHVQTVEEIIEAPERDILVETDPTLEEPIIVEIDSIVDNKVLRAKLKNEAAAKKEEEKRLKKAAQLEAKEIAKSTPKEKKKSRSILLWLFSAILITGGVMYYIKTQREGELHLTIIDKKESKVVSSKVIEKEELRNEIAKHREKEVKSIGTSSQTTQGNQASRSEAKKSTKSNESKAEEVKKTESILKAKAETAKKLKIQAELKAKAEAEKKVKIQAELKAKVETEKKLKFQAELKAKAEAEKKIKVQAELKAKNEVKPSATSSITTATKGSTPTPATKSSATSSTTTATKGSTPTPATKSSATSSTTTTTKGTTPTPATKSSATSSTTTAIKGTTPTPATKSSATSSTTTATKGTTPTPATKPTTAVSITPAVKGTTPTTATKPVTNTSTTPVSKGTTVNTTTSTKATTTNAGYVSTNKNIQVIVGTFKDKSQADQFVTNLKADGFSSAYSKEDNGQFSVSLGSFSTLSESSKALKLYKGGKKVPENK